MRERRHARLKERADREFDKRFGGDDAAASDAGPRAAVTKGAMGARQRRASRLQDGAAGSSKHGAGALSSSGSLPSRLWRAVRTSPRFAACSIVTLGLAVSLAYLYPTAQTYYCAMRQHDKLEVEYAALADRNALLQTDVDSLNTDAGIERHAQEQLGWVKQGEQTANVKGLTLEEDPSEELAVYANVVSSDVSAPTTWYSPVCDALFGFK